MAQWCAGEMSAHRHCIARHFKMPSFPISACGHLQVKFLIDNWTLVLLALSSGGLLLWPTLRGATGGSLSAAAAVQLINREKAVVIDVCEANEYASAHVSGAKHIPLGQLAQQLPDVVKNKELPLIFVCQSGMRSGSAMRIAKGLGYLKAQSLAGGLPSWRAASLPVDRG